MDSPKTPDALSELVVVCCHAVYIGVRGWTHEADWLLQPFQSSDPEAGKRGEHETFAAHIAAGVMAAISNPHALLMFSGGRTTYHVRSEAASYARVLSELFPLAQTFQGRVQLEENATDSYQNLLFSILRFHAVTGRYPANVTVITHAFKERRFLDLHGPAIGWPMRKLRVQGLNPPFTTRELEHVVAAEKRFAYALFEGDMYGVEGSLASKRRLRNWDESKLDDLTSDPNVLKLLKFKGRGGGGIYAGPLPWRDQSI